LIRQTEQRIAASAHLDGDFPQGGPLESQARRLAVDLWRVHTGRRTAAELGLTI